MSTELCYVYFTKSEPIFMHECHCNGLTYNQKNHSLIHSCIHSHKHTNSVWTHHITDPCPYGASQYSVCVYMCVCVCVCVCTCLYVCVMYRDAHYICYHPYHCCINWHFLALPSMPSLLLLFLYLSL